MTKNRETLYQGSIINVYKEDHHDFKAELVEVSEAVCIAASPDDIHYLMVDQYRYGISKVLREFPAGKVDPNESHLEAAQRELREETGYSAQEMIYLGPIYSSPAFLNEVLHLYQAKNLTYLGQDLDEDEDITISLMSLSDLNNADITDAKTLALLYKLQRP